MKHGVAGPLILCQMELPHVLGNHLLQISIQVLFRLEAVFLRGEEDVLCLVLRQLVCGYDVCV